MINCFDTRGRPKRFVRGHNGKFFGAHSNKAKVAISLGNTGIKNGRWKGIDVGYVGLHRFMRKYIKKPKKCPTCKKTKPLDLANLGVYDRNPKNWNYMCKSCHKKFDKPFLNRKRDSHGRFLPREVIPLTQ